MIQHGRIRIVVAQGHCLLRGALIDRLRREPWIEICAVASDVGDAAAKIDYYKPQILVMNIALKCSAGMSSISKLKRDYPGMSIVALSCDSELEETSIGQVLRAGADGYISVDDSLDDLILAIRVAGNGIPYLSDISQNKLKQRAVEDNTLLCLSTREAEVFFLTGCGYAPKHLAIKMNLSVKTIETYRERIRRKMHLDSGADLQYIATNFMRSAARRGVAGSDNEIVKELLSATC